MKNIIILVFILNIILICGCTKQESVLEKFQRETTSPTTDLGNWDLAMKNRDTTYCDRIQVNDFKTFCKAVATGNFELCNSLPDVLSKELLEQYKKQGAYMNHTRIECIYITSTFNGDKPLYVNYCEVLSGNEKVRCKANLLKNVSICNSLEDYLRSDCLETVATSTLDSSVCERVDELELKDNANKIIEYKESCILGVALQSFNVSLCDKVTYKNEPLLMRDKSDCIISIAIKKSDRNLCEIISDNSKKNLCYNVVK